MKLIIKSPDNRTETLIKIKKIDVDSLFGKFKMKLLTAFSWKWIRANDHTIVNVSSIARATGLTKAEIRRTADEGDFFKKIEEKFTQNEADSELTSSSDTSDFS